MVVNCKKRILESGEGDKTLQCHRVHANEAQQLVYHHFSGGVIRRKHDGDAGFDLCAAKEVRLLAGERKIVDLGVRFNIPKGYWIDFRAKSGLVATYGIQVLGGVVDEGY